MVKRYLKGLPVLTYSAKILLFSFLLVPFCQTTFAQVKDSTVTGIYTDFKSYWSTNTTTNSGIQPDSSHNLLAFTFRGRTYSTGVNDAILNTKLGSGNYTSKVFKSLPVSNIEGNVVSGGATYMATAIKNDGDSTKAAYASPYPAIKIADVLTDGKNGLDLGTGVTNLPSGAHISFSIKNLSAKESTDTMPDLIFTQIADPSGGKPDTIFFYDANGKIVGNKKLVSWNNVSRLGIYKLDLYSFSLATCNTSTIAGVVSSTPTREIRMVAFLLTEFGITNADSAAKVKGIQINPTGTSDQAFIAYNTSLISLDAPVVTTQPATQRFCSNTTTSATFSVAASGGGTITYQWKKNGAAIAGATGSSYTVNGLTLADTANAYSVSVTNAGGSVISDNAYVRYVITSQPADIYRPNGSSVTFTVGASGATAYQWLYKNPSDVTISGATGSSYVIPSISPSTPTNYFVTVSYAGGTCNSNVAVLTLENLPTISVQPQNQVLCSSAATSATFSTTATGPSAISYQWYKNNVAISGAKSASYTPTGLTFADTSGSYKVILTSRAGSVTSNTIGFKYLILAQPAPSSLYLAVGSPASFTVGASSSVVTGYQWQKSGTAISGATNATVSKPTVLLSDAGSYTAVVSYSGGTCTSNAATLTVEDLPSITAQPQMQVLCNTSSASATYSVAASSVSVLSYQWYKNGTLISGATSSSYTATGLSYADTVNMYTVKLSNGVGYTLSSGAGLKYLILSQPAPLSSYLATGNTHTFTAAASSAATAFQWKKNGVNVSGANGLSYKIDTVTTASAGNYTLSVSYTGGSCTSSAGVLTTSTILYSKAMGDINTPATWGVNADGSGSSPVDFTRSEHTFIIANRAMNTQASNLTIAGTYDLGDTVTTINPGTTLEVGRIIMTKTKGRIAGTESSSLIVHGKSDLYFDAANKVIKNLTVNTTDTVTLHTALNITAGKAHGIVKVTSGVFNTGDSLVLKSDSLGAGCIGNSPGTIRGKVTVEQYIPAHRAWRLFSSPVSDSLAPTIHAAWQEGAISSTDNPHPGYGTHITYGTVSDGFDQNPQKSYSMKVRNASGQWVGVPATSTTKVTDYPAYFFFIRGNRAYDIEHTTETMASRSTIIRTTGYMKQHIQAGPAVSNSGFTLVSNPYASPVDFESVFHHSSVAQHFYMWNPNLAGSKGVGAYVLVYWNGSGYSTTPALRGADSMRFLQANQGFFVEGNGSTSAIGFNEGDKDTASLIIPFGREVAANTPRLEINLNVFNNDSTTGVADGATYLFGNSFNNSVDRDDITKLTNVNENAGILSNGKLLALEQRALPVEKDSLQLSLTNTKTASYQLDVIPNKMDNFNLYLYDRYTGNKTPLTATDTNHIKIDINTSVDASKAANRFVIISKTVAPPAVMFTNIRAALQQDAIQVDWSVINDGNVQYYKLQKSADGITFSDVTSLVSGKQTYTYIDNQPFAGMNYYRVESINRTGAPSFTGVVSEAFIKDQKSHIAVYPNPVTTNHCIVDLNDKPAGKYNLTLTNSIGVTVFTISVTITDANKKQSLSLPAGLAKGVYHLAVDSGAEKEIIKLVSLY